MKTKRFKVAHIYKITYPNGKIYIGQDRTADINYFGSADSATIRADFPEKKRRDFAVRKQIVVVLRRATIKDLNKAERALIRKLDSTNPPHWIQQDGRATPDDHEGDGAVIIVSIDKLRGTERDVRFPCGMVSLRPLVARDGMGFSLHKTIIPAGEARHWHYTKHLEACYCVAGGGILTDLFTGERHRIVADTVYALDQHDDHTFTALTDTVLISVFNPPVKGGETHREDGSYE